VNRLQDYHHLPFPRKQTPRSQSHCRQAPSSTCADLQECLRRRKHHYCRANAWKIVQSKYRTSESVSVADEGDAVANKPKDDARWTAEAITGPRARPGARPSLKIRIRRSDTRASSDGSFVQSQASSSAASPAVSLLRLPERKPPKVYKPPPTPPTPQEESESESESEPERIWCHQCRWWVTKPKMECSKRREGQICGKMFCDRCIIQRSVREARTPFVVNYVTCGPRLVRTYLTLVHTHILR